MRGREWETESEAAGSWALHCGTSNGQFPLYLVMHLACPLIITPIPFSLEDSQPRTIDILCQVVLGCEELSCALQGI